MVDYPDPGTTNFKNFRPPPGTPDSFTAGPPGGEQTPVSARSYDTPSSNVFATPEERRAWYHGEAVRQGVSPSLIDRVVGSEGGWSSYDTRQDRGTSFGPFAVHVGGPAMPVKGLGDEFRAKTGLDPSDPRNEKAVAQFVTAHIAQYGASPDTWHGLRKTPAQEAGTGIGEQAPGGGLYIGNIDTSRGGLSPTGAALLNGILRDRYGAAEEPTGNQLLDGLLKSSLFGTTEQAPQPSPTDIAAKQLQQAPPPPPPPQTVPELTPGQPIPTPRITPIPQPALPTPPAIQAPPPAPVPSTPMPGQPSVPAAPPPLPPQPMAPPPVSAPPPPVASQPQAAAPPANTGNNLLDRLLKQVSPISTAQAASVPPLYQPQPQMQQPPAPPEQSLTAGSKFPLTPTGNRLLDGIMQAYRQDTGAGVRDVPPLDTYLQKPREPYGQHYFERPADQLPALIADPGAQETDVEIERGHVPYRWQSPLERAAQAVTQLGQATTPYLAGGAPSSVMLTAGGKGRASGAASAAEAAARAAAEAKRAEPLPVGGGAGGRPPIGRVPGAEIGGPGERPPPPGPPPGRIGQAATAIKDAVNKAKTEFQIFATPMATGPEAGVAIAKDFANGERLARWHRMQFDKTLNKFTPQQWREMWDAMDRASVTAQATGNLDAAMRHIAMLDEPQRAALLEMERFGIELWEKARAAGVVSEDATRLPFYVMRGVIRIGEDGSVMPISGGLGGTRNINPIGGNLRTRGAFQREHLTTEETEAAAQARFGPGVQVVRDIRMLPLAYERLEKAIAGRTLINELKGMEPVVGRPLVAEGHQPPGFITIDHPSFKVYRVVGKKPDGSPIWVARPLFVAKEMEGPLRAVLRSEPGAVYSGAMALKAGATSLIMNSPLIHNMVEWGRALPAMPGKIATFRIYGLGRQTLRNKALMEQAIGQDGLVPIGRGYQQDITGIAEANPVIRHRGMLSNLTSIVSERGAQQIDKAGRFWHETLLWDRVAELQAGLYSEMRTSLINRGSDPAVAGKIAAHFANRYAGALPQEAMGEIAKRLLNVALFSRSFTMGNLGVLKDMINGLPRDVRVSIGRDLTTLERQTATSLARRKAIGIVAMDIALAYVGNTLLENAIQVMKGESLSDIEKEYADRFERLLAKGKEHPMDVLNPFNDAVTLLPQSQHEPGKENRVELWQQPDGTMIYGRLPTGKVGEEFQGWMTQPVQMLKNKEGTLARPLFNILNNDRGFGQRVYNPQATGVSGAAKNLGSVVWELLRSQIPEGQVQGTIDAIQGRGGALPWVQALAPFFGMNISKGAPGGPKVGVEMETRRRIEGETKDALPRVKRLVEDGKIEEAEGILLKLGMSPFAIKSLLRTYMDPEGRAGRGMKPFMRGATPEEIERLEHVR